MDCPKVFFFAESESIGLNIVIFTPAASFRELAVIWFAPGEDLSYSKTSDLCCRMPASIVTA